LDRKYSFLKSKRILFLIAFTLIASSCISKNIWNLKEDELRAKIKQTDFNILKSVDFKDKNLTEVFALGPGAGYYFGRIFKKISLDNVSLEMLRASYANENGIWKEEAGILLLGMLLQANDPAHCEKLAREIILKSKDPDNMEKSKKYLIRALFEEKKDAELLASASTLFNPEFLRTDAGLYLYRGAASARLGKFDAALPLIISAYLIDDEKAIHIKTNEFLISLNNKTFSDNPHLTRLGIARGLDAPGFISSGLALLSEECLSLDYRKQGIDEKVMSSFIEEIALAYLARKDYKKGIAFLDAMVKKLDGTARVAAVELLGRTYKKAENYTLAISNLSEVVASPNDPGQKDRATLFLLDAIKKSGSKDFFKTLIDSVNTWNDIELFNDLLESEISDIVAGRRWIDLTTLYDRLKQYDCRPILTRLSYLLARVVSLNVLEKTAITSPPREYLEYVSSLEGFNYYTFLASAMLDKVPPVFEILSKQDKSAAGTVSPGTTGKTIKPDKNLDSFVKGFFDFGLIDEGFDALKKNLESMSDEATAYSLARLKEHGYCNEYIRVANKIAYLKNYLVSPELIAYQFPLEYSLFIDEYSKRDSVHDYVMYGLVRQESAFDPSIVSSAGAIGLSQLMPETAKDIAALLKMKTFDLNDPRTNISIGSYYFARLNKKLGSVSKALIGYNAGITHTKEWSKAYADLPQDFLVEAIPYAETRDYMRKVISSSLVYGYFYKKLTIPEMLQECYPDLIK
jgi:hypothetical protein